MEPCFYDTRIAFIISVNVSPINYFHVINIFNIGKLSQLDCSQVKFRP